MLEGFGSTTRGGNDGETVYVSSLADSGEGSLREALDGDNRHVLFNVAGTITLETPLELRGRRAVTVSGDSALGRGITLSGQGVALRGCEDIILRHLRIRDTPPGQNNIQVWKGSRRVVVDHCSLTNTGDTCVNITEDTVDVTVSWCLMADTREQGGSVKAKGLYIHNWDEPPVTRISIHHNLFSNLNDRMPQLSSAGLFDVRNNVILGWVAHGMRWRGDAFGNVEGNFFASEVKPAEALILLEDAGRVYVHGNVGPDERGVDYLSTRSEPYVVAEVTTEHAMPAWLQVMQGCGAQPRDQTDQSIVCNSIGGRYE